MYDHRKQLKCAIIRARAISDVDNLLPKYATVIDNLCPCTKAEFEKALMMHLENMQLARQEINLMKVR